MLSSFAPRPCIKGTHANREGEGEECAEEAQAGGDEERVAIALKAEALATEGWGAQGRGGRRHVRLVNDRRHADRDGKRGGGGREADYCVDSPERALAKQFGHQDLLDSVRVRSAFE